MSKRKCPYLNYEWCWGEDGEEFKEKICPIESHYKDGLIGCFYSTDYKDCITYNLQQEKVRLNNIINELEKYIKEMPNNEYFGYLKQDLLDKLKELKEGK